MDFVTSLISVGILLAMAVPGFVMQKAKLLPEGAVKTLTALLLYACQIFLTIASFAKQRFDTALLANMGWMLLFGTLALVLAFGVSRLIFAPVRHPSKNVCVAAGFLSNCVFMGLPVLLAFFPNNPEPIIYCAVFAVPFNTVAWVFGPYTMTGDKQYISLKKALLNPPTLALLVALPIFFLSVSLPEPVMRGLDYLGNTTTPLAMILLGIRLACIPFKELFNSATVYLAAAVRLIIVPLTILGMIMLIKLLIPSAGTLMLTTLYVVMAMPTASTVLMFSERFNADGETAAKCVLLSSVLSVITIPVLMLLTVFI
jgi:predicted permease